MQVSVTPNSGGPERGGPCLRSHGKAPSSHTPYDQGPYLGEKQGLSKEGSLAKPRWPTSQFCQEGVKHKLGSGQAFGPACLGPVYQAVLASPASTCSANTLTFLGHEKYTIVVTSCPERRFLPASLLPTVKAV